MAILVAVAVFDTAVGAFNRPFFVQALPVAVRSFTDEVNRAEKDNPMYQHPSDYQLWYVGNYDEETGTFGYSDGDGKRMVCRAQDVRQQ